jgi:hypothetical protein
MPETPGNLRQPLGFFSHKLSPTETCYSTFDRELPSFLPLCPSLRFFLGGHSFTLFTHHKPLVAAISKASTPFSSRQQRHLSFLSKGASNLVADFLSRSSSPTVVPANLFPIPLSYLKIAQKKQKGSTIPTPQKNNSSLPVGRGLRQVVEWLPG